MNGTNGPAGIYPEAGGFQGFSKLSQRWNWNQIAKRTITKFLPTFSRCAGIGGRQIRTGCRSIMSGSMKEENEKNNTAERQKNTVGKYRIKGWML
jgi:hypothetical protein